MIYIPRFCIFCGHKLRVEEKTQASQASGIYSCSDCQCQIVEVVSLNGHFLLINHK